MTHNRHPFRGGLQVQLGLSAFLLLPCLQAHGLERVRFVVVDPATRQPITGGCVVIENAQSGDVSQTLFTPLFKPGSTSVFNLTTWSLDPMKTEEEATLISIPVGASVTLQPQTQGQVPVKEIFIKVTATRIIPQRANPTSPGTTLNNSKIEQKAGVGGSINRVIEGTTGVASDSAGQQHVRGEHADLTYVVDGVPLPDTLSGRQGSVVVPATIQRLEILTGGFAPEFGGQTAAVLNISTLPGASKSHTDLGFEVGNYRTTNGGLTTIGALGKYASYVIDLGVTRSLNYIEPQQPDNQTAHNAGSSQSYFTKLRYNPGKRDTLTLTLSRNPDTLQISNRTGLPLSFASAGQGFGFLGLRNADGSRPDVTADNGNALGAQTLPLPSQQAAGQDITQREVSEFATLSWRRQLANATSGTFALTLLHAGQDLHNGNPAVNLLALPVDNSIEFNPTSTRNIHHVQLNGNLTHKIGSHEFKVGFVADDQNGEETYNLIPGSQLALNELAALSPSLAPEGVMQMDAAGSPVLDVNNNPIYTPTSGISPTLRVHRSGFYRAAYAQDTWGLSRRLTLNYGLRADWYKQAQNIGQSLVNVNTLSPRLNFSYAADRVTTARMSYNRLFNTPPLAQGAIVGQPIQPELLDQYDLSVERRIGEGQTFSLAYYVKQISNQVDTGLLIPGSQIGLYSAVNLQIGGIHGIEAAYEITPRRGVGFNLALNYSYSIARPNGLDNTGANVPNFNDHDQRNTVGFDAGYTWKSGASASLTINHGSGLASSPIAPSTLRVPRTRVDLRFGTGLRLLRGKGGLNFTVENLFDDRTVINFQSAFSGTRFQQGRRVSVSFSGSF